MTPPLYRYVKGQGWVLTLEPEAVVVTMACGTRVSLEMRKPLPGERWDHGAPDKLTQWARIISALDWKHLCTSVPADYLDWGTFCVVIPALAPEVSGPLF